MTEFNTLNPVPSSDVRDLLDNATIEDKLVNGLEASYPDRFGRPLKSKRGMELDFSAFLAASGFELPALEYVDGSPLTVDRPTQLILRDGILYSVKAAEPFPATLTGTFATDQARLTVRNDSDLRTELFSSGGAGLIGFSAAEAYPPNTVGNELENIRGSSPANIELFGGVADGITDNMPALMAALAASPTVVFPSRAGVWRFSSFGTYTLSRDIEIDFNGQKLEFQNARINLTGPIIASGRTITANAARYAKTINLNTGAGIQAGDIIFIETNQFPSSDWPDKKNDCVRVRSVSGAVLTLDEGLNFSYATSDPGLSVTVYRPFKARIIRPIALTIAPDTDTTGHVNILCTGMRDVELISPEFRGQLPFNRSLNIYRNGFWVNRCVGLKITNMVCEAMSYAVGVYGGSRNTLEIGTTARYMHHSHADIGGWGSDYRLIGLHSSDSYQGLNTHPCFRAFADGFTVLNDTGISNWRCCGGGISNGYISSSVDDTAELPQFQNTTPSAGYEYINADADFYADNVVFDYPNRISKGGLAVRYGRSARYSNIKGDAFAGLASGELALFICGPGNRFGASGSPVLPPGLIFSAARRIDVPQYGVAELASSSALLIPQNSAGAYITGSTTITNIDAAGFEGKTIALIFTSSITVQDGDNLRLAGNFTTTSSFASLTLFCRAGFWYEVSRSVN